MKPIYFPFTFISTPDAEAMAACFGQTVVYQPLDSNIPEIIKTLETDGLIDIRVPHKGDEEKIISICKDYRKWLGIHLGSEIDCLKIQGNKIPFFDDSQATQIKAALKRNGLESPTTEKPEQVLAARIFLYAAQQFDMENWEILKDLVSVEKMEMDLIDELRGEQEDLLYTVRGNKVLRMRDPGDYMTVERVQAWARLFLNDRELSSEDEAFLFVTTSRTVFEHVMDNAPHAAKVLQLDALPVFRQGLKDNATWRERFNEHLQNIANNDGSRPSEVYDFESECMESAAPGSLDIYLVHGETSRELFMRCIQPGMIRNKSNQTTQKNMNILVGMLSITA